MRLPETILRKLSGGVRQKRGRTLDPKLQMALCLAKTKPNIETLLPSEARKFYRRSVGMFDLPKENTYRIENFSIPVESGRIGVRLYRPSETEDPVPALVYFHGGGFVIGDLETHDSSLRYISKISNIIIISVDYRLAPEHKYPSAVTDGFAAYLWIVSFAKALGIDPKKIAVGGDSAGGNIAANVCILSKKKGSKSPSFQVLVYPYLDLFRLNSSRKEFGNGYALTNELLDYFNKHYLNSRDEGKETVASPIFHKRYGDFPKTYVQLAGFDPLQDEGMEFIDSLQKAGVSVRFTRYETLIHGYFNLAGMIPEAKKALDELALFLKDGFKIE
ncbi:alpha/beta hydrolase [Leptospira gomenensis]|uniref:alpha/beta hydrolase n=1 Tax=Leptospira gomenensis TaxID=2484974 RepID=UPI001FEF5A58|nr:alpha/beta hydrolase [Leptospira gomenensis]